MRCRQCQTDFPAVASIRRRRQDPRQAGRPEKCACPARAAPVRSSNAPERCRPAPARGRRYRPPNGCQTSPQSRPTDDPALALAQRRAPRSSAEQISGFPLRAVRGAAVLAAVQALSQGRSPVQRMQRPLGAAAAQKVPDAVRSHRGGGGPQHHEKCYDPRNRNCEHQKDAKYDFHKTPPDAARMLALQSNRRKP